MKPGARIAAAVEALNEVEELWLQETRAPVDAFLNQYFRRRRFIGSKDRGAVSRMIYSVLRNEALLNWHLKQNEVLLSARTKILAAAVLLDELGLEELKAAFCGQQYCPSTLSESEIRFIKNMAGQTVISEAMPLSVRHHFPEWLESQLVQIFNGELAQAMDAMKQEASVDLRVNTIKTNRPEALKALTQEGLAPRPTSHSKLGIRLGKRGALFGMKAFRDGWFEMQDEGSQLVAQLVQAKPGEKGIDFCAGAGGKTLALAAQMENRGRILAWDISGKRLGQMKPRLGRAGVSNVQARVIKSERDNVVKRHRDSADWVLLDVPCSGTGTWRRNPDLRRRTTQADLSELKQRQKAILESAARLVKAGGRLVYATCSILPEENEVQITEFRDRHPDFVLESPALRLYPHVDGTDGFFGSVLRKK